MLFDKTPAQKIIKQHKLATATLYTWRHRNTIPDKYNKPAFTVRQKLTNEKDRQAAKNILRALQTGKFNLTSLSRLAGLQKFFLADFMQGKTSLGWQELLAIRQAVNTIRNEAKAILPELEKAIVPEQTKKLLAAFIVRK